MFSEVDLGYGWRLPKEDDVLGSHLWVKVRGGFGNWYKIDMRRAARETWTYAQLVERDPELIMKHHIRVKHDDPSYRVIQDNEVIDIGDEYYSQERKKWIPIGSFSYGMRFARFRETCVPDTLFRRKFYV